MLPSSNLKFPTEERCVHSYKSFVRCQCQISKDGHITNKGSNDNDEKKMSPIQNMRENVMITLIIK